MTEAFDDVAPDASAMIESMRAHGYTLAAALSDLIDNSITAKSRNIWIDINWHPTLPWISLTDDGEGMTETTLVQALRLGSQSPIENRDKDDLGRFGLGLKTASFSQARRLTVISRRSRKLSHRRWDLDYLQRPEVTGWQLLKSCHADTKKFHRNTGLDDRDLQHGTQVILEILDRISGEISVDQDVADREAHFNDEINRVREHLVMVFHQFLSRSRTRLRIYLNGSAIEPWDPFLVDHPATQEYEPESRSFNNRFVKVTGYVLPHHDKFEDKQDHKKASGPNGWNDQQGIYLYRANRLIVAGNWLHLGWQNEEHYKLARIRLDIPNNMDQEWQIDVKKSTATPPPVLRTWLKEYADAIRQAAMKVYRYRGNPPQRAPPSAPQVRPWKALRTGNDYHYKIDRKHPLLAPLIKSLSDAGKSEMEVLLKLIEETVPIEKIWIDRAENPDGHVAPLTTLTSKQLRQVITTMHRALASKPNMTTDNAWKAMLSSGLFDFDQAQAIIGQLREEG
jgi:hypothetical protein